MSSSGRKKVPEQALMLQFICGLNVCFSTRTRGRLLVLPNGLQNSNMHRWELQTAKRSSSFCKSKSNTTL